MAMVAHSNPGALAGLGDVLRTIAWVFLALGTVGFLALLTVQIHSLRSGGEGIMTRLTAHLTGPLYATIPGSITVLALAYDQLLPTLIDSPTGWWLLLAALCLGAGGAIWLTIVFFAAAFEHDDFDAQRISGTWFVPETVMLLSVVLSSRLARTAPDALGSSISVVTVALMGAGFILFLLTASLFFTRLVILQQTAAAGIAAMWIMLSPLASAALALHALGEVAPLLVGEEPAAISVLADLTAGLTWGFALWWLGAAGLVTAHGGLAAMRFSPGSWAFVFPPAALTLSTVSLARLWESDLVEVIGIAMATLMMVVFLTVGLAALSWIRNGGPPTSVTQPAAE